MNDRLALCYHAVSDSWPAALAVTPARFESQMWWLARQGYRGVTFGELVVDEHAGRRVAVSFDDGYRSVLAALPVLEHLGWPATIFVPAALMDSGEPLAWPGVDCWLDGDHRHELMPLSWAELRALADRGWEIGSHTLSHPRLTQLDDHALRVELDASRAECERQLGRLCASVAYPYGDVDGRVVATAGAAGYVTGAALGGARLTPRVLAWPRVGVYRRDSQVRFRAKVSRGIRFAQRSRGWPVAKALHGRLPASVRRRAG